MTPASVLAGGDALSAAAPTAGNQDSEDRRACHASLDYQIHRGAAMYVFRRASQPIGYFFSADFFFFTSGFLPGSSVTDPPAASIFDRAEALKR